METQYANVHRGLHWMSERTTDAYEAARDAVAALMNAADRDEIVFVRNSTEAINLVAHSFGRHMLKPGQAVLISGMEHHSNIVPWQMLRDAHGTELRVAPITDSGELDMAASRRCCPTAASVSSPSRICRTFWAPSHRPNGSSASRMRMARKCCSTAPRPSFTAPSTCRRSGCDFYCWTGHKLYGPTGIGVLWARRELLERNAAVPRRRRNDLLRHLRKLHLGCACRTSSRPERRRSWKASA